MKISLKSSSIPRLKGVVAASATAIHCFSASSAWAADAYWDTNGDLPGAGGATPSGNWDDLNWTLSSMGDTATEGWFNGDVAVFAADTDAGGAYLVNLDSIKTLAGIRVEEGSPVIFGGGTLQFSGAEPGILIPAGSSLTLTTGLAGAGKLTVGGLGTLTLDGSGTYSGEVRLQGAKTVLAGSYPSLTGLTFGWNNTSTLQNLEIVEGAEVSTEKLVLADWYYTENTVSHSGGTLTITGTNDSNSTSASFLMGHWGYGSQCVYGLSGGTLNSLGARLSLGWDRSNVQFQQSGGTANLLGINLDNGRGNSASFELTGGRLNLGAGGINNQANKSVKIGTATLGAFDQWTSTKPLSLMGGTLTVDTTDAFDGVTDRSISLLGGISETAASGITKTGAGILALDGPLSYTGPTVVEGGKLLPGPSLTTSTVEVLAGGALGAGSLQTAGTSVVQQVHLNGGSLSFRVGAAFDVLEVGQLEVYSPSEVRLEPTQPVNPGDQFAVVKYGTLGGLGFDGLSAGLSNPHYTADLVNDEVNKRLLLQVTGADTIVWNGSVGGGGDVWDTNASANWMLSSALPAVTASAFYDFDLVTFDDRSSAAEVSLPAPVRPAAVTVNSDVTNYSFSGSPIAGSASLTKAGSSTLTLASPNTFSGPVTIAGGRVIVGAVGALGSGATPLQMGNGAVLEYQVGVTTSRGITMTGATAGIEVAENATLSMGAPASGPAVLTKGGAGKLRFTSYGGNSFGGASIVVNEGSLEMANMAFNSSIGMPSITVNAGAELLIPEGAPHALGGAYTTSPVVNLEGGVLKIAREQYFETLHLRGGTVIANGSAPQVRSDYNLLITSKASSESSVFSGVEFFSVNSPFQFVVEDGVAYEDLILSDVKFTTESTPITKSGPGTMVMNGNYTYLGSTVVTAGTLMMPAESSKTLVVGVNGVATNFTGEGAVDLDCTLVLDLSGAEKVNGNSWTLVGTTGKNFGPNFKITGFTETGDVHLFEDGNFTWTFEESTGILSLSSEGTAYDAYELANQIVGAGPDVDSDGDGVTNGMEFVLGGISDPAQASSSRSLLPQLADLGAAVRFRFHLTDEAAAMSPAVWSVEFNDDLEGEWTTVVDPENASVTVVPDGQAPNGSSWSLVDVVIPKNALPARFVRLRVSLPATP